MVDIPDADQESGVECTAGQTEIVVLRHQHAMYVDCSRSGVSGMSCWHVPIWSSTVYRWLTGRNIDGVGEVGRNEIPCDVRHHESEGTHEVVGGAHVPSMCFHIFGPGFQVVTRVINEGGGDVESRGGQFQRVRMNGWMGGC